MSQRRGISRAASVTVVSGENRSANRTKWASAELPDLPTSPSTTGVIQTPFMAAEGSLEDVSAVVWDTATSLQSDFMDIDRRVAANISKVQDAYRTNRIGPHHFQGSTGYGHGDFGREALDNVS